MLLSFLENEVAFILRLRDEHYRPMPYLNNDAFLRLSFLFPPDLPPPCLDTDLRTILMAVGSRLLPPVLIEVVSSAVARRVTASPPDIRI